MFKCDMVEDLEEEDDEDAHEIWTALLFKFPIMF